MYEPEEFLDTLDRMIELSVGILADDDGHGLPEETRTEITADLAVLRDLHHRIRLQFGIEAVTWN
jgi:hypothetical protein